MAELEAIKVGWLQDRDPLPTSGIFDDLVAPDTTDDGRPCLPLVRDYWRRGIQLRLDEFHAAGGYEGRAIEIVARQAAGAHQGLPDRITDDWRHLTADVGVIAVLGPGLGDNALPLTPVVDACEVATIQASGATEARGRWYFHWPAGSHTDECAFLANAIGPGRVAVLTAGRVGRGYFDSFAIEAAARGVEVVAHAHVPVHVDDVLEAVRSFQPSRPDALVFLGMGPPTLAVGRAVRELGWDVRRFANIAMANALFQRPDELAANEGVVWPDQVDMTNAMAKRVFAAYTTKYSSTPLPATPLLWGYDMLSLVIEGLRRAPVLTRAGLREGLERVQNIPCATGGVGALMGFGNWDRQAIKGAELFTYRTVRDGNITSASHP